MSYLSLPPSLVNTNQECHEVEDFLKRSSRRIIANKHAKGFPIGKFSYDFKKLREEVDELEKALNDNCGVGEEASDIIIYVLGIVSQYDARIDMDQELLDKIEKIEKRKITKLADDLFTKEEGA